MNTSNARTRTAVPVNLTLIALLGALSMLGPLSIDISLPGLPQIARALSAPGSTVQWTLSAFVAAFGSGQLVMGALSDRFGRRRTLLFGLALFTASAAACACVGRIDVLIALRALQGFGACAGTITARAIVADVAADERRATSLQAYVSAINALAPILAPLLGAAVLSLLGWRWLYGMVAVAGAILMMAALLRLRETAPPPPQGVFAGYRHILGQPRMPGLAAYMFCAFAAFFAMISGSPLVLETQLHLSSSGFAVSFALSASAAMLGSFAARRWSRFGAIHLLRSGSCLLLASAAIGFVADLLAPSAPVFVASMAFCAFCFGLTVPGVYALGLGNAGSSAGVGVAILGASQMFGGSMGSALAGTLPFAPAVAVGAVVLLAGIGAVAAMLTIHKIPSHTRSAEPRFQGGDEQRVTGNGLP